MITGKPLELTSKKFRKRRDSKQEKFRIANLLSGKKSGKVWKTHVGATVVIIMNE
jgi:hypothetical protein